MQKTRQKIIEYLREHETATVDELSEALDNLTAVTVRHHLDILRSDGMIAPPEVQHRNTPGRPKYVYRLTKKAESLFPRNFGTLSAKMIEQLKSTFDEAQINVFFNGVADRMAEQVELPASDEPFERRLDRIVEHLTAHGYEARWEKTRKGYVLHTANCPYAGVVDSHAELCRLDERYITRLLGTTPQRVSHIQEDAEACSYLIHDPRVS